MVNAKDSRGRTALNVAARGGLFAVVTMLMAAKANVNLDDNHGRTALHFAAANGFHDIVEALIESGAWIECEDYEYALVSPVVNPNALSVEIAQFTTLH